MKDNEQVSITFRLSKDERKEIDNAISRIGQLAGFGNRSISPIFRLAVGFVDQLIRDAEEEGRSDREAGKSLNMLYDRPSDNGLLQARAASYKRGYFDDPDEHSAGIEQYRAGKAQGENDRQNAKPSWLNGPLTASETDFAVGYFDGYHGGFMAGLNKGEADRERHDAFWASALDRELSVEPEPEEQADYYEPPQGDPDFRSGFAIGYRTGFRSRDPEWRDFQLEVAANGPGMPFIPDGLSFPAYQDAYKKGSDHRDRGAPYDPSPGDGVELDEADGRLWAEGYYDGYRGGFNAGFWEGMADWLNDKPPEQHRGRSAFSDLAIGYRAGYGVDVDDQRDRGFTDYMDGRALGIQDKENRVENPFARNHLSRNYVAGYQKHLHCSFAAGYRAGREVQDTDLEEYRAGFDEGMNCRDQGRPARQDRWSDSLRDAGYRAGYHRIFDESDLAKPGPAVGASRASAGSVKVEIRRKRTFVQLG